MGSYLKELFVSILSDIFESTVVEFIIDKIGAVILSMIGIVVVSFLYSGFVDFSSFKKDGIGIFILPVGGVLLAIVLFIIMWYISLDFIKSHSFFILINLNISLPLSIPYILMIGIREQNIFIACKVALAFLCFIGFISISLWLIEFALEWSFPIKILVLLTLLAIDYLAPKYFPSDLFGINDIMKKYEPLTEKYKI